MEEFDLDMMRNRLAEEISRQHRSMAEVSAAAGLSKGYIRNVIKRDQVPTIDKLHIICRELKVPLMWIVYGVNIPPEARAVCDLLERDPKRVHALLVLAQS